jgi:hypothetical protein
MKFSHLPYALWLLLGLISPSLASRPVMTREECLEHGGIIVGDIGDGAIHRSNYRCASNGRPPIATVVPLPGEPIPIEGEVCCGTS